MSTHSVEYVRGAFSLNRGGIVGISHKPRFQSLNQLWNEPFSLSQLLQWGIIIQAAVLLGCFAIYGKNQMVDIETVLLVILLSTVLWAALYSSNDYTYPHVILLVWIITVFFIPRILFYLMLNDDMIIIPFKGVFTHEDVNRSIVYLLLGSFFMIGGFRIGSWLWCKNGTKPIANEEKEIFFSPVILAMVWLIVFAVEWYFMIWRGNSVFNLRDGPVSGLWLIHLFSSDTIMLITVVMVLSNKWAFVKHRRLWVSFSIVYLLTSVLEGSRGGPARIGLIIGIFLLAYSSNFRVSLKYAVFYSLSIVIVTTALYPVSTGVRYYRSGASEVGTLVHKEFGGFRLAGRIVNRLGYLDYVVGILSQKANDAELSRYMSMKYALKSLFNNAVLGTPFPEAEIMTSRVMPIIYRGAREEQIRKNFLSEAWTIWGLSFVFLGWWGGLVAMFVMALLVQIVFLWIMNVGGAYKYYAGTYYLFGSSLGGFFISSGLDHWMTIVFYFFLSSLTAFALLHGTSNVMKWFRLLQYPA